MVNLIFGVDQLFLDSIKSLTKLSLVSHPTKTLNQYTYMFIFQQLKVGLIHWSPLNGMYFLRYPRPDWAR